MAKIKFIVTEGKEKNTIMCKLGAINLAKKHPQTLLKKLYDLGYTLYISKDDTDKNA